jgi:hypothetical protein
VLVLVLAVAAAAAVLLRVAAPPPALPPVVLGCLDIDHRFSQKSPTLHARRSTHKSG